MSDHIARLLRDSPELAGQKMDPPICTRLESEFYIDRCFIDVKWLRYWRWLRDGNDPEAWRVDLP